MAATSIDYHTTGSQGDEAIPFHLPYCFCLSYESSVFTPKFFRVEVGTAGFSLHWCIIFYLDIASF